MKEVLSVKNGFSFFKFTGIATIDMKEKYKNGILQLIFSESKSGIFYNIFLIVLICLSYGYCFTYFFSEVPLMNRSFTEKIKNASDAFDIISAIWVLAIFFLRQKSAIKILRGIYIHKELYFRKINKHSLMLKSIVFLVIGNVALQIFILLIFGNKKSVVVNVYIFLIVLSRLIATNVILQYSMLLELISQFFESINHDLQELSKNGRAILFKSRGRLLLKVEKIVFSYESLVELSKNISDFYAESMLICIPRTFIVLVSTTYNYWHILFVFDMNIKELMLLISLFTVFFILLILTTVAEKTVSESKETGRLVHMCMMSMDDPQVEYKFNRFSYYLLFARVKFSVYDMYTLNQSFFMTIIGATVTYVVVLLQF